MCPPIKYLLFSAYQISVFSLLFSVVSMHLGVTPAYYKGSLQRVCGLDRYVMLCVCAVVRYVCAVLCTVGCTACSETTVSNMVARTS